MPGPPRTPTALKDQSVSKQSHNKSEPKPEILLTIPPPSEDLSEGAKKIWAELAEKIYKTSPALLTNQDLPIFRMLIESFEIYEAAQEKIKSGVTLYSGRSGRSYTNPAIAARQMALQEIIKLSAFFGLTPSHRATMKTPGNEKAGGGPEASRRIR